MTPLELVRSRLKGASGDGRSALCPAHDDKHASLSIGLGNQGQVLLKCHAGCDLGAILDALGLQLRDLRPSENGDKQNHRARIAATYDYCDESGELPFQVVRFEPKDFRQRRPDGKGGWIWNLNGVRRVPYRLNEIISANPEQWIFACEGEKDVENLRKLGLGAVNK